MRLFSFAVLLCCAVIGFTACRSSRKIQRAIAPKDTIAAPITDRSVEHRAADSLVLVRTVLDNIHQHNIDYQTFSAKVKVNYANKEGKQPDFTANIRMKKDSIIWVSITGPLGIEGFRVLITQDTVRILDKLANTYQVRSVGYLQEIAQIPLDFHILQDLIVGNAVFFDSANVRSVRRSNTSGDVYVLSTGQLFKNLITLSASGLQVVHSKLDDANPARNRTADLSYGDYQQKGSFYFATSRNMTISEKSKLDIDLNYKQFDFDAPLTYPFSVKGKFKRIK